jgi:hypothetical protein
LAKPSKLTGKIVAYDVMHHASKTSSALQNQEVVILETGNQKQKYVKVMFASFGTTQIEQKYFDGTAALDTDVFRDHSCDEDAPALSPEVTMQQIGKAYLLTDAFKTHPPEKIKKLNCYVAIYKKK